MIQARLAGTMKRVAADDPEDQADRGEQSIEHQPRIICEIVQPIGKASTIQAT